MWLFLAHAEWTDPSPCLASWYPYHKNTPKLLPPLSRAHISDCRSQPPLLGKDWLVLISHLRLFSKSCPTTWLGPAFHPITFFSRHYKCGKRGGLQVPWLWFGPSGWGYCQIQLYPPAWPWELLYFHREKAVAFGADIRAGYGWFYETEATTKGGWHGDRLGVSERLHSVLHPLPCRSASVGVQQREINHLNKTPNFI